MVLTYTPKAVMQVELEAKKPLTEVIADYSFTNLVVLVSAGLGVDKDTALAELDKYFSEGGEMQNLYLDVLEGLQNKGFLPRSLDIATVRGKMNETLEQATK